MLMEVDKRKRVLKGFGVFLGGMLVLTLVSRGIYAEGLARVSVEVPERMAVGHVVEVSGNVKQSRELAVNVAEGLRVREVFVIPGDRVEAGSELFALDLDFLEERIRDKERDVEKLRLQIATVQGNLALAGEEKNVEMSRAGEDAVRAGEEADKALRRAEEDLASARASLQEHLDKNLKNTSDEERQRQEEAYQAWKKRLAEGGEREKSVSDKVKGLQRRKESLEGEIAGLKEKIGELEKKGGENGSEGTEVGTVSGNGLGDGASSGGSGELDALKAQLAEKEAELVQVKKELSEAGWEQEDAAEQLGELQGNAVNKPDFSEEDSAWESWMSTRKSLEEKVQDAERALEDAEDEKEKALEDAQRNLEDSLRSEQSDSTLGLYQLDLEEAGEELKRLKGILEQEGVVKAEASGMVTRVGVAAGEQTSSGASVVFADTARPLQFEVILQKEEKKYVNLGAEAEITLGNSSNMIKATVDYLTEMETSPGSFTALVTLPEGTGTIGQSGMFRVTQQSEMYNYCIPVDALHMDENQRNFVYVLGERSGFLGAELTAEKLMVDVLDKNDKYAALAGGVVDGNSRIICTADREISDGDPVRMKD
ncbi:efflux RND transporter periplasmic adaptor subunit [Eisenbergiella tayi]